jgi:predicted Zn-dependent protease with MMP-like domain
MDYDEFQAIVAEMVDEIPEEFLRGLQGVHALEQERPEEEYEDVWRLGEYLDPGAEDFLGAGEGLGRHVALYFGSFCRIAELDLEFDWVEEIWETLTHELRHHVESLAGDATLIDEDLRQGQSFERRDERS